MQGDLTMVSVVPWVQSTRFMRMVKESGGYSVHTSFLLPHHALSETHMPSIPNVKPTVLIQLLLKTEIMEMR